MSGDGVWCRSEMLPLGGGYMLVITYDEHHVLSLTGDEMSAYINGLSAAVARAHYAEAIRSQLTSIGLKMEVIVPFIMDVRDEWPELPSFAGYSLHDVVSAEGLCSVQVRRGERVIIQMEAPEMASHLLDALTVYAGADLDSSYLRILKGMIGLAEGPASMYVSKLSEHLPESLFTVTAPPTPKPRPPRPAKGKRRRR